MSEIATHVSILIPVHNEETILSYCAASWCDLLQKLGYSGELLFIDDGSTDSTPRQLEDLQAANSGLRFIRNSGKGQHRALIDGIAAARGRIIVTGDADLFPTAADLAEAVRQAEGGLLVVMRREYRRCPMRRAFSLANNGLLSFLSGRSYGDIGSMQMCFMTPGAVAPLSQEPYLPLELESLYERVELSAVFRTTARPSRYNFWRLAKLSATELQALGRLPGNRHPRLLQLLNEVLGRLAG